MKNTMLTNFFMERDSTKRTQIRNRRLINRLQSVIVAYANKDGNIERRVALNFLKVSWDVVGRNEVSCDSRIGRADFRNSQA